MTDENKEKIELTPAEDDPWYQFYLQSIVLDRGDEGKGHYSTKPYGWHWFWGIYFLHQKMPKFPKFNLTTIQKKLPNEHWLKNANDGDEKVTYQFGGSIPDHVCQGDAVEILQKLLEDHEYSKFSREINFSNLIFKDEVNFSNFIFPVSVSFLRSNFHQYVSFNKTFFYSSACFTVTEFSSIARFNDVKFFSHVTFSNAIFSEKTSFNNTTFSDDAIFYEATFSNVVSFTEAKFFRITSFDKINFCKNMDFSNVIFSNGVSFTNTMFSARAIFDDVKIIGFVSFENAEFKEFPPSFQKANLYSNILWDECKWPKINKKANFSVIRQNKNIYENLSSLMKSLDKYHDHHLFYRQETRCRRWLARPLAKCFYWLYEKLANYGYGIERALLAWSLHILLGAVLIWATTKNVFCALQISFANAHGFLPFHNAPLKKCYAPFMESDIFNAIWVFQTIAGIPLLFLVLLTIRVRFRLK